MRTGVSPLKAARVDPSENTVANNNNTNFLSGAAAPHLEPSLNVIARCNGQHIFAILVATPQTCENNRAVQLQVWKHRQQQRNSNNVAAFSTKVILTQNFFRKYNINNNNNQSPSSSSIVCYLGEGVDGSSVIISDADGNAGTISIPSNSLNNNNNFQQQQQTQMQQQQIFLHTASIGGISSEGGGGGKDEISAFNCQNGIMIFSRYSGFISVVRVVDRAPADRWTVMTTSHTQNNTNTNANNNNGNFPNQQQQQQQQNTQNQINKNSAGGGWSSWIGGLIFGSNTNTSQQSSATTQNKNSNNTNLQQQQQSSSSVPDSYIQSFFPSFSFGGSSSSSSTGNNQNQTRSPAWFSTHSHNGKIVYHGSFEWEFEIPFPSSQQGQQHISPRILAVGDSNDDNGNVYVLYTEDSSSPQATNYLMLACLNLKDVHTPGDLIRIDLPRFLTNSDFSESPSSFNVIPCRLHSERRVVVVTPQSVTAHTVTVGPRTPFNEVTMLETSRFILSSQLISSSSSSNSNSSESSNLSILSLSPSSSPFAAAAASNSNNNNNLLALVAVSSFPIATIFSSNERQNDSLLLEKIQQKGKDNAFNEASATISSADSENPWNWMRQGLNTSAASLTTISTSSTTTTKGGGEDINLLTFISNSLSKRLTDHQLFLKRWQNDGDIWNELSDDTRASCLNNHIGLSILNTIRVAQNTCRLHPALEEVFGNLQNSEFDRLRTFSEIFAELIPRVAKHPKVRNFSTCQQNENSNSNSHYQNQNQQSNNNDNNTNKNISDAEILFGHPDNGFLFLQESALILRDVIRNLNIAIPTKLMMCAVISSIWFYCCDVVGSLRNNTFSNSALNQNNNNNRNDNSLVASSSNTGNRSLDDNHRLWVLTDNDWLDNGLRILIQSLSDCIALSVDASPVQQERELVQIALVDVCGDLVEDAIELHTQGKSISSELILSTFLREPFLTSSSSSSQNNNNNKFGFPYSAPQPSTHSSVSTNRRILLVAENISIRQAILDVLYSLCSSTKLMINENSSNNSSSIQQQQQQNLNFLQQRFKNYTERISGFFEFACARLLEEGRELELSFIHTICDSTPTSSSIQSARENFLMRRSPSALWTMDDASGSGSAHVDAVLASCYENKLNAPFSNDSAPEHRNVCVSLAKLAWVADGRALRFGRKIGVEQKVSQAQQQFLPSLKNKNVTHTECIRQLLSMNLSDEGSNNNNNIVTACELADLLPRDDPARTSLLREILNRCFVLEGTKLLEVASNQSIGDAQRLSVIDSSLTAKTLNKSSDLLVSCGAYRGGSNSSSTLGDETIASSTSQEFAAMLHQWRLLKSN